MLAVVRVSICGWYLDIFLSSLLFLFLFSSGRRLDVDWKLCEWPVKPKTTNQQSQYPWVNTLQNYPIYDKKYSPVSLQQTDWWNHGTIHLPILIPARKNAPVTSKFIEFLSIYRRLSLANSTNIGYWQTSVTSTFYEYWLLTDVCH